MFAFQLCVKSYVQIVCTVLCDILCFRIIKLRYKKDAGMEEGSVASDRRICTFKTREQTKKEDTGSRKKEFQTKERERESLK